jgi:hypothetical protein
MRHHAETSATTIADLMLPDLRLSHHTLVQQFDGISLRSGIRCGEAAVLLFAAIDLLFRAFRGFVPVRISAGQAGHFGSQPGALGRAPPGRGERPPSQVGLPDRPETTRTPAQGCLSAAVGRGGRGFTCSELSCDCFPDLGSGGARRMSRLLGRPGRRGPV